MIKTTVTLTCDHCGTEIKAGERFYKEKTKISLCTWDGNFVVPTLGDVPEHKEYDLCPACRDLLHGVPTEPGDDPTKTIVDGSPAEDSKAIISSEPAVTSGYIKAEELPEDDADTLSGTIDSWTISNTDDEEPTPLKDLLPAATKKAETAELPMTENVTAEEMPMVAEDVETGETIELDGKVYTEYCPSPNPKEDPEPVVQEPVEQEPTIQEPAAEKPRKKSDTHRHLTEEQKELVVHMRKNGASFGKIADTIGVSVQTAWNVCEKAKKCGAL